MWRMHAQKESVAEGKIYKALRKAKLHKFLHTDQGFRFNQETEGVYGTWPDFLYVGPHRLAIFIDGPHHLKKKQEEKDRLVVKALERRGFRAKRFSYKPPLSKKRLREIVDEIRTLLDVE